MGSHFLPADTQKHAEYIWRSADGGKTWGRGVAVAKDAVHMYCEGAYVPLAGGALLCVMRDNLHHNYPSQVSLSFDNGDTWTAPVEAPFAGDRPFIGQLADGRILVTFRNQAGTRAPTPGWARCSSISRLPRLGAARGAGGDRPLRRGRASASPTACRRRRSTTCSRRRATAREVLFEARVTASSALGLAPRTSAAPTCSWRT